MQEVVLGDRSSSDQNLQVRETRFVSHSEVQSVFEYIRNVGKFRILTEEEEKLLLIDFFENHNKEAGRTVLNSHLRLVVKIAIQYKKYHASLMELIAEGNLGLLKALKKFSLQKQVRFSTYAMLWVKASIMSFISKSFSSLKIGTTNVQKKIILNLSKVKKYLGVLDLKTDQDVKRAAEILSVRPLDIKDTQMMLYNAKELSLNDVISEDRKIERGDAIYLNGPNIEEEKISKDFTDIIRRKLHLALDALPARDAEILKCRVLSEKYTLSELAKRFNISIERVRQIQSKSLEKLHEILKGDSQILEYLKVEKHYTTESYTS